MPRFNFPRLRVQPVRHHPQGLRVEPEPSSGGILSSGVWIFPYYRFATLT